MKALKKYSSRIKLFLVPAILITANIAEATGGLSKVKGTFELAKSELLAIIPVVATIVLILLGIAYANKMIERESLERWVIGTVIAGAAAEITTLFFK